MQSRQSISRFFIRHGALAFVIASAVLMIGCGKSENPADATAEAAANADPRTRLC